MAEIIVVLGAPGSGKSTQCESLTKSELNQQEVRHLSAGKRLRDIRTGRTESSFAAIINHPDAPSPLDDQTVNDATFELLPKLNEATLPIIALLDGYPRHPDAVDVFIRTVKRDMHKLLGVLALHLPVDISIERALSRGVREGELIRQDSFHDFVVQRHQQDKETVDMSLRRLSSFALIRNVDASGSRDEVASEFKAAVLDLKSC